MSTFYDDALCVSKSRYANGTLHIEARNPRASPRRAPDEAVVSENSGDTLA